MKVAMKAIHRASHLSRLLSVSPNWSKLQFMALNPRHTYDVVQRTTLGIHPLCR